MRRVHYNGHVRGRGGFVSHQTSRVTPTIRTKYKYETHVKVKQPKKGASHAQS